MWCLPPKASDAWRIKHDLEIEYYRLSGDKDNPLSRQKADILSKKPPAKTRGFRSLRSQDDKTDDQDDGEAKDERGGID